MDAQRWDRLQSLFLEALEVPAPSRAAWLASVCADDADLADEITTMLDAHESDAPLAAERWNDGSGDLVSDVGIGVRVGPYRTKALLGRGGMGEVYLAERADAQYSQDVALKLVRRNVLTGEAASRFRAERQILARLNHPNIARLLDGGVTELGRPYLVMEYVDGAHITEYCERDQLDLARRLRLFLDVCAAVDYAHRNLVVHRDVKSSNVLVGDDGIVKLLDFGIAKLLGPDDEPWAELTLTGSRVMTTESAAPEQVQGGPITTATDVYALGMLLYELLTLERPYRIPPDQPAEAERIICTVHPARPSTVAPDRWRRALRGDLDTIVLMALRKEPERRYATASNLAEDIRRYLAGRPVLARKDSVGYRFRKHVRRNRTAVSAAAVIAVLLVASTITTAVQAERNREQRDLALRESARAERVTEFLVGLFDAAAPTSAPRDTLPVREFLERGREQIDALIGEPELHSDMLQVLSHAYWRLGRNDRAEELALQGVAARRDAYGADHPATAIGLYWLGTIYQSQVRLEEAADTLEQALRIQRRHFGPSSTAALRTQFRLAGVLHAAHGTARAESLIADWEAILDWKDAEEDEDLAILLGSLGQYLHIARRQEEARAALERAITIRTRLRGPQDYRVAEDLSVMADVLVVQRSFAEAESVARLALEVHRRVLPDGHFGLARSLGAVGEAIMLQERYAEAEPYLLEAIEVYRRLYEEDQNIYLGRGHLMLAQLYHRWKQWEESEHHHRVAVRVYEDLFSTEYLITIRARRSLARMLMDSGRHEAAAELLAADLATLVRDRGSEDRDVRSQRHLLLECHEATGRQDLAESLREEQP